MKNITIQFTRKEALELDLLTCVCNHRPNNHFNFDELPCAHCECNKYREMLKVGKIVKRKKKEKNNAI